MHSTITYHGKVVTLSLRLDQVTKNFVRDGRPFTALSRVSLVVEPGEMVAVIGGRGCGKSTLLNIAAGLMRPDAGVVTVDDVRLDSMSENELTTFRRKRIGCVWTTPAPTGHSKVIDLVGLPLLLQSGDRKCVEHEARNMLEALDIGHCAKSDPTVISDGERRLVAMAQALIVRPRVLLLDQPATDLNLADERNLLDAMVSLTRQVGASILMTARSAIEAVAADRTATLVNGHLVVSNPRNRNPEGADVLPIDAHRNDKRAGDDGA
ncbi:MAG: ATP-binding cassette domain-containing protein [Actinobacteria bacterium]|nr:ATP-binding cassette domain-containing protein [Actinomycetota bacterium]